MRSRLWALLAAVAMVTFVPSPAEAHGGYGRYGSLIAKVKKTTDKYHSIDAAIADGYLPTDICVPGMGYHYVNPQLMDDDIDALEPEALLYAPGENGRRLVGVEYLKPDADQNLMTDDDKPKLFGQWFQGPMEGHEPGMPIHYDLHAWIWLHNPDGRFAEFNPRVSCE